MNNYSCDAVLCYSPPTFVSDCEEDRLAPLFPDARFQNDCFRLLELESIALVHISKSDRYEWQEFGSVSSNLYKKVRYDRR